MQHIREYLQFLPFLLDSSSSDSDNELIVLNQLIKVPRLSIEWYYENVVSNYNEVEFIRHFRMDRTLWMYLSQRYGDSEEFHRMARMNPRTTTPPGKALCIFLWFAGHEGCSYRDIGDRFNVSISTVRLIILRFTNFFSGMSHEMIRWPSSHEEMQREAEERLRNSNIPGIIGCVDGTHVRINPPKHNKDDYVNRKGHFTLQLQAVCDSSKKFIDFFCGYPGSVHDSRVYRNSRLPQKLQALPEGYRIVGDSAYPCQVYLLTPYRDTGHLGVAETRFNAALRSERIHIEHSFGILKQRWRQLYYCNLKGIKFICHFIRACVVLHNLSATDNLNVLGEGGPVEDDAQESLTIEEGAGVGSQIRNSIRDTYFST